MPQNKGQFNADSAPKQKKRHILRNSLVGLAIVLGGLSAVGYNEYQNLQPQNHFKHVKMLGSNKQVTSHLAKLPSGEFNVLLMGTDKRKTWHAGHSDSMILIHVDLKDHRYNMVSIPRDARVYDPGHGYTKLTSVQYIGQAQQGQQQGVNDAITSIEKLTGVPINYYAETNYSGFESMVNAVGGITMKIPYKVTITHPWAGDQKDKGRVYQPGTYQLSGVQVASIVHERYSLKNGDYGRQKLQEEALVGIAKKLMKPSSIPKLPKFASSIHKFLVNTNMSIGDMLSLGMSAKGHFSKSDIHYYQIPGKYIHAYDQILQAYNDEIQLNKTKLHSTIQQHFVGPIHSTTSNSGASSSNLTSKG